MNEYKLTVTVAIKAQDDPAARKEAQEVAEAVKQVAPNAEMKLKQVYADQPPRGVRMS